MEAIEVNPEVMVAEFQAAFEPPRTPEFWDTLVKEELAEVEEAFLHLLKELADLGYVLTGRNLVDSDMRSLDGLEKRGQIFLRLLLAIEREFGHDMISDSFKLVHESNMSKLGDDGKPLRREDGKVLKGPNYRKPDLSVLLEDL